MKKIFLTILLVISMADSQCSERFGMASQVFNTVAPYAKSLATRSITALKLGYNYMPSINQLANINPWTKLVSNNSIDNSIQEIEKPEKRLFGYIIRPAKKRMIQNVCETDNFNNIEKIIEPTEEEQIIENIIKPTEEDIVSNVLTDNGTTHQQSIENSSVEEEKEQLEKIMKSTEEDIVLNVSKNDDDINTNQQSKENLTEEEQITEDITKYAHQCMVSNASKNNDISIHQSFTEEEKEQMLLSFLEEYAPPKDLIPLLDKIIAQPKPEGLSHDCYVVKKIKGHASIKVIESNITNPAKKCFFVKYGNGINRLFNAICLKAFIQENKLTSLDVAKKYIYCKNNKFLIIAENVEEEKNKLNQHQIMQLIEVSLQTGFWDWQSFENIILTKNGKITFIDTENRSFQCTHMLESEKYISHTGCSWHLIRFLLESAKEKIDFKISLKKLDDKIAKCKKNYKSKCTNMAAWSYQRFNYYKKHDLKYIDTALKQYQNKERDLPTVY